MTDRIRVELLGAVHGLYKALKAAFEANDTTRLSELMADFFAFNLPDAPVPSKKEWLGRIARGELEYVGLVENAEMLGFGGECQLLAKVRLRDRATGAVAAYRFVGKVPRAREALGS